MYCRECGAQVADGKAFCGSCGAAMGGEQAGAGAPEAARPATPPPAQMPAPPVQSPPGYSPPAEPALGGGSAVWIIGCVVALMLGGLLAGGGYLGWRHLRGRDTQAPAPVTTQTGTVIQEPGGEPGGPATSDEAAVGQVVLDFYKAWARGDIVTARTLCTRQYADTLTPDGFGDGYEQYEARVVETKRISGSHWEVVGFEAFLHTTDRRATQRSTIQVVRESGGWRVSDWQVDPVEFADGSTQ